MTPISTRPPLGRLLAALLTLALLAGACGDGSDSNDSSDSEAATASSPDEDGGAGDDVSTTIEVTAEEESATGNEDTTVDDTDDAADGAMGEEGVLISVTVAGGTVSTGEDRYEVPLGSLVTVTVEADVAEHIHVHGYDLLADVAPGSPAEISFEATTPGIFEVELEDSGTFLFEIAVS